MERVVLAFENENTSRKVRALLEGAGLARGLICRTAAEVRLLLGQQQIPTVVCGYKLPEGLLESARLEQPLFTPSTKAELGEHDENISTARAAEILGKDIADQIENIALALFKEGRAWAESRGIIIADTKFEFGMVDGELILIDEVLTPDSSRFWPAEGYKAGQSQPSFDKQYLRDWLSGQPWDKTPPPPALPKEVVEATQNKYLEAYRILTGSELAL